MSDNNDTQLEVGQIVCVNDMIGVIFHITPNFTYIAFGCHAIPVNTLFRAVCVRTDDVIIPDGVTKVMGDVRL